MIAESRRSGAVSIFAPVICSRLKSLIHAICTACIKIGAVILQLLASRRSVNNADPNGFLIGRTLRSCGGRRPALESRASVAMLSSTATPVGGVGREDNSSRLSLIAPSFPGITSELRVPDQCATWHRRSTANDVVLEGSPVWMSRLVDVLLHLHSRQRTHPQKIVFGLGRRASLADW